ncbi:MAG TPA: RDD family protein [Methylomirabilota bacterium]|jgi:uncharacterized RDD family membrane protein YckC|nr:RDD family protein [Methylomirabilota bacterium]
MNGVPAAATHPAGFWIRLVAFVIDLGVVLLAQFVLTLAAMLRWGGSADASGAAFFTVVFALAYPTVLHTITGQTLGKLVTRVRVVAVDGGLLPLGAALLRAVASWVALVATLGIGHIIGGLRKDKRALHDLVAGSRAERVPRTVSPRPAAAAAAPRPAPPAPAPAPVASAPSPVPPLVPQGPFHRPPSAESEPPSSG